MELAEPRVVRQPRFLRRNTTGGLNGKEVLTEYNAAFQFGSARVGTMREVDGSAVCPEVRPIRSAGGGSFGEGRKCLILGRLSVREEARERQLVFMVIVA